MSDAISFRYAAETMDTSGAVECVNPWESALAHKELEHCPAPRGQKTKFFRRYPCILYRSDGVAAADDFFCVALRDELRDAFSPFGIAAFIETGRPVPQNETCFANERRNRRDRVRSDIDNLVLGGYILWL